MPESGCIEVPPEAKWSRKPPQSRRLLFQRSILACLIGALITGAARAWLRTSAVDGLLALFVIALGMLFRHFPRGIRFQPNDVKELIDDPEDLGVALVELRIVVDGKEIAEDLGAAFFQDRALAYHGRSTSFRVGPQHVVPFDQRRKNSEDGSPFLGEDRVALMHPNHRIVLTFLPRVRLPDSDEPEVRFRRELKTFVGGAQAADGPFSYPPLRRT